jgi:methionine-rich copper-binding protein CopC
MKLFTSARPNRNARYAALLALLVVTRASAATTLTSVFPANGATGVSTNAPVVFTFSEAMNPMLTGATFIDPDVPGFLVSTTPSWSADNTVLTCAPVSPWGFEHAISWSMTGKSAGGVDLAGNVSGQFTTGIPTDTTPLVITNYTGTGSGFAFDVTCDVGRSLIAEYRTNLNTGLWQTLATTNATTTLVHFAHPNAGTNRNGFYRVRVGP